MAHKSRLGCIVIDCPTQDLQPALAFWSAALGLKGSVDQDGKYAVLKEGTGEPRILLQAVDHAARVHLDIETDDKDAEAVRLEAVGARRVAELPRWIIMEAPTGHRFCLVGPQRPDFEENAAPWA
ncbi:MAG: VOC family protein [Pseudomonadota bacterium]